MMLFSTVGFVVGFAILAFQPWLPLNPDNKGMLSPSMIFNTASSFLANTQLQHYSGEVHLSYFSQLFFIIWMDFIGPIFGLAACVAVIRGLRGEQKLRQLLRRYVARVVVRRDADQLGCRRHCT